MIRSEIDSRTNQRVDVFEGLASPECNQPPGTTSHIYDYYENDEDSGQSLLLATVHMFKKTDGTIGASGQPDPYLIVVNGQPYIDP